jgi:hypothetical protein
MVSKDNRQRQAGGIWAEDDSEMLVFGNAVPVETKSPDLRQRAETGDYCN